MLANNEGTAVDDEPQLGKYVCTSDGWALLGDDGWPITVEELRAIRRPNSPEPLAIGDPVVVIDVDAVAVTDTEVSR